MDIGDISLVLGLLLKTISFYFGIIMLFAVFRPRRPEKHAPKTRFAVLIAARNEEAVIPQLVGSLLGQDYPKALYDIYVVPNNCTDDTRGAALRAGARVIDCRGTVHTKGEALRQAMDQLMPAGYDAFCVFDADNVVDSRFLSAMNDAFCGGAKVAKGRNEAKNPYDSWVSGCYGIYFGIFNHFYNRGRAVLGLSAKLVGTGFAVHRSVIEQTGGWNTQTIAEDAEFAATLARLGHKVAWVPDAVAWDEEPLTLRVSLRQRKRWCSGIMQVSRLKLPGLIRTRGPGRALRLDSVMFLLSPYAQAFSCVPLILGIVDRCIEGPAGLWALAGNLAIAYLAATGAAALIITLSRQWDRRIIKSLLTFAIFMATWLPLQLYSLAHKTTQWEEIEHTRALMLEDVA